MPEQAEIIPIVPDIGNAIEGNDNPQSFSYFQIHFWGALIQQAEIIPIVPEPDNAGEGKAYGNLTRSPHFSD